MSRAPWITSVGPLLGLLAAGPAAAAPIPADTSCDSDDICEIGMFCARVWSEPVECTPGDECVRATPVGQCKPLPQGYCEGPSDCAPGLECQKSTYWDDCYDPAAHDASVQGPSGHDGGGSGCPPTEVVPRYGRCSLPVTPCEDDTQCLDGLSCVSTDWVVPPPDGGISRPDGGEGNALDAGGSIGSAPASKVGAALSTPDGGVASTDASQRSDTHECRFDVKTCAVDTECGVGYECAQAYTGSTCSGDAGIACSGDGGNCPAPEPRVCTEYHENVCYPKKTPCSTNDDCTSGWKCVEFTNQDGGLATPEWWSTKEDVRSCVPAGLAVLAGSADGLPYAGRQVSAYPGNLGPVADSGGPVPGYGGSSDAGAWVPPSDARDGGPPRGPVPTGGGSNGGATAGATSGTGDSNAHTDSGLCAVGFAGGNSTSAAGLLAALLGLVIRRRRRA